MRNRLIAMVLILLLAGSPCAKIAYASTAAKGAAHQGDEYDNNNVNDKVYQEIKAAAEARRDELLYLLELELPQDIMEKLEEALYVMEEAEETEGTKEATQQYMYALKQFRSTWQKYINDKPDVVKETFEKSDESDKPKPEDTEPPEDLEEEIKVAKEKRLVKIQEEVKEKIVKVSEHVDELKEYLSEEDSKVVEKAIENEEKKLEKIMDKVSKGEYDDAIDELIETEFDIEDDVEEMEDKEAAETLKNVEKIQSQVQKTKEQKQKKAEEGEDTSEEDNNINKFFDEITKIKFEFKRKSELKFEMLRRLDREARRDKDDDDRDEWYDVVEEKEEDEIEKEEDEIEKEED